MQTTQANKNSSILMYVFYGLVLVAIIGVIVSFSMSSAPSVTVYTEAPQAQGMMRGGPLSSVATGEQLKQYLLTTDEDGNMQHSPIETDVDGRVIMKAPDLRINHGKRGMLLRNDGDNTSFLHTNENDADGVENANRPLTINNASGAVSMGNGLTVNGGLNVPSGNVSATGNVTATGNMTASGNVSATGNVSGTNLTASGNLCIGDVCIDADHLRMLKGERDIYLSDIEPKKELPHSNRAGYIVSHSSSALSGPVTRFSIPQLDAFGALKKKIAALRIVKDI